MGPLAPRTKLRLALAAALAAAALSTIAIVGSSSGRAPAATPPMTANPSVTPSEIAGVSPTRTPSPTRDPLAAPVDEPSFAPDGRTGDPGLDALLDRVLASGTAALRLEYPDLPAHEQICRLGCVSVPHPSRDWAARLSSAKRSLYAVFTGEGADAHILLAVDVGERVAETWEFKVVGGRLKEVSIFSPHPDPGPVATPFYFRLAAHAPSPASQYERFYVLPPRDTLPKPPRTHALSVRTREAGADRLLAILEARDAGGLLAAFVDPAAPLVRQCQGLEARKDAVYAASWSRETARQVYGVHSVARPPDGYQPRADHLVIAVRQLKPYWWVALGILERQGRVVGVITGDWGCHAEALYPPARYLVPPPDGGLAGLDPSRRSGIGMIDAVLDAARAGDAGAMAGLIVYRPVACGESPVPHGPPPCPPGAAPGTPVDVLYEAVCAPIYYGRERAPAALIAMLKPGGVPMALYAVAESGAAVLASKERGALALGMSARGVTAVSRLCGPAHPEALLGSAKPSFLLPPL